MNDWQRHTPQFAPPVWWGDSRLYAVVHGHDMQERMKEMERNLCDGMRNARRQNQAGVPLERAALGPNQIAWCKDHLRGFSLDGERNVDGKAA